MSGEKRTEARSQSGVMFRDFLDDGSGGNTGTKVKPEFCYRLFPLTLHDELEERVESGLVHALNALINRPHTVQIVEQVAGELLANLPRHAVWSQVPPRFEAELTEMTYKFDPRPNRKLHVTVPAVVIRTQNLLARDEDWQRISALRGLSREAARERIHRRLYEMGDEDLFTVGGGTGLLEVIAQRYTTFDCQKSESEFGEVLTIEVTIRVEDPWAVPGTGGIFDQPNDPV